MPITLDDMLLARDRRAARQRELQQAYPSLTLLCTTIVMPGNEKRNSQSLVVATAASSALQAAFEGQMAFHDERDLPTGYEIYTLVHLAPSEAKRMACHIEDSHPLGRLFDIDVLSAEGTPLSRTALGFDPRTCLLCGREARFCMRNHSHSYSDIQQHINTLIDDYVHRV